MDYQKHYDLLINRAKQRSKTRKEANKILGYSERHHIIPRCAGGSNDINNLVYLTPEEHYVAHQLLVKIYPRHYGLINAALNMCVTSKSHQGNRNNKLYGWLRRKLSKAQSKRQTGKGNSQYGTIWITDGINNKKIKKTSIIPEGWKKGKIEKRNGIISKKNQEKYCQTCEMILGKGHNRKFCDECRKILHNIQINDIQRIKNFKENHYHSSPKKSTEKEKLRRERISKTSEKNHKDPNFKQKLFDNLSDEKKKKRTERQAKKKEQEDRRNRPKLRKSMYIYIEMELQNK